MQIGSLVECINDNFPDWVYKYLIKVPTRGEYYTVREIGECSCRATGVTILLEEIVNRKTFCDRGVRLEEPRFCLKNFREVLPPINIEEAIRKEEPIKQKELIQEKELA